MLEKKSRGTTAVIAREMMRPELEFVCEGKCVIDLYYLEQSLQRTPSKII